MNNRISIDSFQLQIANMADQLRQYCRERLPAEAGGLIVQNSIGKIFFFPTENRHDDSHENFSCSTTDYVVASKHGDVIGMVHSHSNATIYNNKLEFSDVDKYVAQKLNLYSVLVIHPTWEIKYYFPGDEVTPYLGRPWHYPFFDCLNLIRDVYERELNIHINDYDRFEDEWFIPGWNRYNELFPENGFVDLPPGITPAKYDICLFAIRIRTRDKKYFEENPNHGGIVWDIKTDGTIEFIHHLQGEKSKADLLIGSWQRRLKKYLRHESFMSDRFKKRRAHR